MKWLTFMPSAVRDSKIPLSLLFGAPAISGVRLSLDGRSVAGLVPTRGAMNLTTVRVEDLVQARDGGRIRTQEQGRGIEAYRWSADGRSLIYDIDPGGDESWQVRALDLERGDDFGLTPTRGVSARYYASSAARPGWIAVGLNERDPRWHDVYWIEIATKKRELALRNEEQLFGFVFDRQLVPRLALRAEPAGRMIVRLVQGRVVPWRRIAPEDELVTQLCGIDEEGKKLWWVSGEGRDKTALICSTLEPDSDPESDPDPDSDPESDPDPDPDPEPEPDPDLESESDPDPESDPDRAVRFSDRMVASNPEADIAHVVMLPEGGGPLAAFCELAAPLWIGVGEHHDAIAWLQTQLGSALEILSVTADASRCLVARRQPELPPAYFVAELRARVLHGPLVAQPELRAYPLAQMNARVAPSRDGLPLVSYLSAPSGPRPAAGWPTILWVHGGPWRRDSWQFDARHQWLASRGYAVLSVCFRGSTGLGKAFINAADGEWGGKMHDDLLDSLDTWAAEGWIDPARVAIAGGSFGGYAALTGMTKTPARFACGVSICGPSNLVTSQAQKPAYWAAVAELRARRIGDPRTEAGRAFLAERSPLTHADRICRPLLIAHGANDPRVRRVESDQLVAAAQRNAAAVTYLVYPDEGHGLVRAPNRMSFYAVMEAFLAAHLGAPEVAAPSLTGVFDDTDVELAAGAEHLAGLREAWASRRRVVAR